MGRYVFELLQQSCGESDIDWTVLGDDTGREMVVPAGLRGRADTFTFRGDRFQLWEQIGLPNRARQGKMDVLHCTEGTLPLWQPVPTVVTVHDTLAWKEQDGSLLERIYFDQLMPVALRRCAGIVTISESSRCDILAKWPDLEPKLTVIPHGIASEYLNDDTEPERSELQVSLGVRPYVVYMGGPLPRKRFDWALRVMLECGHADVHMVACGYGVTARELAYGALPEHAKGRVHFAPFLSDEHLRALYRGASAALYPTLYEGFGFPAVEAQASGSPVLFSPTSSLAELIGPLSLVAPTEDLAAWVVNLRHALQLGSRRAELAAASRAWAQQFSWWRSYESHARLYARVARGR